MDLLIFWHANILKANQSNSIFPFQKKKYSIYVMYHVVANRTFGHQNKKTVMSRIRLRLRCPAERRWVLGSLMGWIWPVPSADAVASTEFSNFLPPVRFIPPSDRSRWSDAIYSGNGNHTAVPRPVAPRKNYANWTPAVLSPWNRTELVVAYDSIQAECLLHC